MQTLKCKQRSICSICSYEIDLKDQSKIAIFSCNIRAFKDETFQVWRCPSCKMIHCLDIIDLEPYYAQYPYTKAQLSLPFCLYYRKRQQQLEKYGLNKASSILDYGCGANGLQVQYLRKQGYINTYGYDPYASQSFNNRDVLQYAPFDFILLQDVIEHAEDPHALLTELDDLLALGGHIVISTPNATNIDLDCPDKSDYYNEVHVPFHLHIFSPESLEALVSLQKWKIVEFCDRAYNDTRWFGLNPRAWNTYQRCCDGTLDTVFEPIKLWKAITSSEFIFNAFFGYWRSYRTGMTMTLRKLEKKVFYQSMPG